MRTAIVVWLSIGFAGVGGTARADVIILDGAGPIPGATHTLNFDTPPVASGPYAANAWAAAGFSEFAFTGDWTPGTDTITQGSNNSGQSLGSRRAAGTGPGSPAVMGLGEPLDDVASAGGLSITLASPATAFSWLFVDQINFAYSVELWSGPTLIGFDDAFYGVTFPRPECQVNAGGVAFDRVQIIFVTDNTGVAFDNFAYAAVPGPGTLVLLGTGWIAAARRRRR
jgi:hypothetical protein